jgi:hypothetical protein
MNTLNKVINYRRKLHIEKMWNYIFDIGWGIKTNNHKILRKTLPDKYSEKEIIQLKEFSVYKRRELQKVLNNYTKINNLGYSYYHVSDDGFWDLTAHIVGLGKERYYSVVNDPSIAREISLNYLYIENFEYSFTIDKKQ